MTGEIFSFSLRAQSSWDEWEVNFSAISNMQSIVLLGDFLRV